MSEQSLRPCIFFDRDGVVNRSPGLGRYVTSWEDFHFSDGIFDILRMVFESDYAAVLVTSQRGVARGLMKLETLNDIHERMQQRIEKETGGRFLDIQTCTHDVGECTCRKPSPEMIFNAAAKHSLNLTESWMIGDNDRDIEMAHHAGIPASHTIRIKGEHEVSYPAAYSFGSVQEFAENMAKIFQF